VHDGVCLPQVYGLMERGAAQRATGATKLNEMSSRSHAVFIIIVEKSTVMAEDTMAAEDEEMEQFRGLAPGVCHSLASVGPSQSSYQCYVERRTSATFELALPT